MQHSVRQLFLHQLVTYTVEVEHDRTTHSAEELGMIDFGIDKEDVEEFVLIN